MNIVHITGYYPPHLGGMEYRTKDIAEMSAAHGHNVQVLTSDIGCKTGKLPDGLNLKVRYLKSIEFAHTPLSPMLFFRLLRIPRDSIVHLHIAHALISEITYLACKLRGIPYVATIHLDVSSSGSFGFLLPVYKKYFLSRVIRNACTVTVLTKDYKRLVSDKYLIPQARIVIVPNGTRFTAATNRKKTLHAPVRLLFVGRLSVQKNIPLLISAIDICINRYTMPVRLTIAGSGEKEDDIRKMIRELRLEKHISLVGEVSAGEAQQLYRSCDIFILPSKEESFGTVIIEAMASGIPVIATNIVAVRNTIRNNQNGLLVNQSPDDVAAAIRLLTKNAVLRKRLITNGLRTVKKYNWEKIVGQFEDIYRKALRKTSR